MKFVIILLTLFVTISLSSCSRFKEQDIDERTKVRQLLNKGEADEAIVLLKDELKSDPENQELLFLLSTAYASKGNVDIFTLYPVLEINLFNKPAIKWGDLRSDWNPYVDYLRDGALIYGVDDPDFDEKLKNYLDDILTFTWGVYEMFPIIGLTPYLNDGDRVYIDQAISILFRHNFTGKYAHEAMLYRSLLSAVQIVTLIKDILHIRDMVDLKDKSIKWFVCRIDLRTLSQEVLGKLSAYGKLFTEGLEITDFVNKDFDKMYSIANDLWSVSQHTDEFDTLMDSAKRVLDENFFCEREE